MGFCVYDSLIRIFRYWKMVKMHEQSCFFFSTIIHYTNLIILSKQTVIKLYVCYGHILKQAFHRFNFILSFESEYCQLQCNQSTVTKWDYLCHGLVGMWMQIFSFFFLDKNNQLVFIFSWLLFAVCVCMYMYVCYIPQKYDAAHFVYYSSPKVFETTISIRYFSFSFGFFFSFRFIDMKMEYRLQK